MMRSHFNPPMTAPPDDDDKLPNLAPTDRATLGTGHARRRTMESTLPNAWACPRGWLDCGR
jgi:hypothetical protein